MKQFVLTSFFSFLFILPSVAQEYLGDDLAFFEKKSRLYQRWLDYKDLGQVIRVDSVQLQKNGMELELWLSLKTTNPDSAAAIWSQLNQNFRENNPNESLAISLYNTFTRMMEIPPSQGNIQVYFPKNKYEYNQCFYVWIWDEIGSVKTEERINACRALPVEVVIDIPKAKSVSNASQINLFSKEDTRQVFEKILDFSRKKYEHPKDDRDPRVGEEKIGSYSLSFSVTDLSKEVLTEEKRGLWCGFVNKWWGSCNDMRRERLEFEFNFIPTEEGYTLKGILTGKFGSGIYRPRKSGYMDMHPDFEEDFLEPYIYKFQKELQQYLIQNHGK